MVFEPFPADLYLTSMLNATQEGLHIYWLDLQNRVLKCNLACARFLGFENPQELYGKTLTEIGEICHPDGSQFEILVQNNAKIIRDLKTTIVEERMDSPTAENYFLSYKAPFFDSEGKIQGIMGISTNITEHKKLEKELRSVKMASDRYLESILLSSPNNIYWTDRSSKVIGCNDQQAKYCGFKNRADMIGKDTDEIGDLLGWPEAMIREIHENNLRVMENRETLTREETINIHGKEEVFLANKSPMFDEQNNVIGMMGISTNITQQKNNEKELQKAQQQAEASNRAKTRFISNISHDIRTPLVGIQGLASILKENLPQEYQQEAKAIIDASEELLILLNNVINLSKLEDDAKELKAEVFDLKKLIDKIILLFTPVAKQKGLELKMVYDDNLPKKFVSDPLLIQRSILNLISNALKFTEKGHVIVKVISRQKSKNEVKNQIPIQIRVEDTGIGIPPQEQKEIFESFYRSEKTQGQYRGSGLGLSIVVRFLNKLRGKIKVESEPDKGSQFIISLNLQKASPHEAATSATHLDDYAEDHAQSLKLCTHSSHKPRVLLVEDNPLIQRTVENLLQKLSCDVEIAHAGWQVLKLLQEKTYDIIFMDIGLPDQDGLAVAKQIRRLDTPQAKKPIIALTARADIDIQQACFESGMNEMIVKPITLENAQAIIEKYVFSDNSFRYAK
jgi:two-component system aerobic respiration control sensor histidine kinase ArcB